MNLEHKCLLERERPVLVGVSGGPDSLCLLDTLHRLNYPLIIAHLDHGLRRESTWEAETLGKIAKEMELPFISGYKDVKDFAQDNRLSLEEAARLSRYRFLFMQAISHHAQAVVVGHTADDQIETVLMHLLRGAGLPGLKGMTFSSLPNPWSLSIPLVRPLLDVWREDILAYLVERDLKPFLDASNLDSRFYRNHLRNQVIPYLENIQPGLRQSLWRTSEILGQDYAVLENLVDTTWRKCVVEENIKYLAFAPNSLVQQPLGLLRHLLRRGIGRIRPGLRDVDFEAIERAIRFLNFPSRSGKIDLVAGLYLLHENDRLWLASWEADLPSADWPQVRTDATYQLEAPGEIPLENGWRMVSELVSYTESSHTQAFTNVDPLQAWLDVDCLQLPLVIRSRRPGDRIQLLGMEGRSVKIADLMINLKLPRRARARWPLVLSGKEIAWVPGLRIGQNSRVSGNTRKILRIRLSANPSCSSKS